METFKKKKLGLMPLEKRLMLDASITGAALWLDAADMSTIHDAEGDNAASGAAFSGSVATWMDKSGNGRNVTSGVAGERPVYGTNTLNGLGTITFDGGNDRLLNSTATIAGNDITMFVVFNRTTGVARDGVFELGAGGSRNAIFVNEGGNNLISYYSSGTFNPLPGAYTPGTYTLISLDHINTTVDAWKNAGSSITAGTTIARTSTTGIYVGDDSSSGDQLQGNIAEILVFDYVMTSDQRHYVENYLGAKWGLTITNTAPTIDTNTGVNLMQSGGIALSSLFLSSSDVDNADNLLEYTITNATDFGTLTNSSTGFTLGLGSTFTQSDISSGYILYSHDGSANFSDGFTFTVNDLYATTAPQTFNFTMTPSNQAPVIQGWTQVSSENFEAGATGWSDNTTETSTPYLSRFLGRHSLEGGAQNTHKTYALSGTQDYTVVTFDFYEIDSWDGESFRVFIDNVLAYNGSFSAGAFNQPTDGSSGVVSWQIQELTSLNTNFVYNGWTDQIYRFTLTIDTSNTAMKLGFSSTLDQGTADEAWGVDNIRIYEVANGGAPGPFAIAENSPNGSAVGSVTATDPDVIDSLSYTIIGGTGASIFGINSSTGAITVTNGAALNYEVTPSYTLTVRVQDNGTPSLSDTETFTINVLDIPENTPPVIAAVGPFTVAENAANNTVVGTVTATDAESNAITYSITGGNGSGIFAINSATGAIRILSNANLNYEAATSYALTVTATDNGFGNAASSRVVTVNVTNVNEAPTFDPIQAVLSSDPTLRYNAATGNFYKYVGTAVDLAAAQSAAAAALINGVAGHLVTVTSAAENTFVRGLNTGAAFWMGGTDAPVEGQWRWTGGGAESGQMFWLGAAAGSAQNGYYTNWAGPQPDDSAGNEDGMQMMISGAWNDLPVATTQGYVIEWEGATVLANFNGPYTVTENVAIGTSVGFAYASDPDVPDTRTFSVTGGTGAGFFAINSTTGQITTTAAINFEASSSYTLNLRVQDAGGLFENRTVTVNVTNVNEAPVLNPAGPFAFAENTAPGTAVTTMVASDQDTGQTLTYSITGGNVGNMFAINSATGALTFAQTPNFEHISAYTLTVRVTDNGTGSLFAQRNVVVNITNLNEAPVFDSVQQVLASDPTLRYNATSGNFYRYVNNSVTLASAQAIAASTLLDGQAGHLLTVSSASENALIQSMITSSVWIDGSDAAVEGSWRWASGPDAGQLFWLGAAAGSAQNGFYTNWQGGEPNDSAGNEDGIQMLVSGRWNDINAAGNNAYVIEWEGAAILAARANGPYTIAENSAIGTVVGFAYAVDPDPADTRTFSITGGSGAGLFAINPTTGQITLTGAVNFEAATSYTLDLRAQDNLGLFSTRTVTINISDVNEAPVLNPAGPFSFAENIAAGTAVTTMMATDVDAGQTLTYSIQSGNNGNMFAINSATGALRFIGSPNFELQSAYNLVIRATDNGTGSLFAQQTVVVNITNVNEAPVFDPVQQVLASDPNLRYNATTGNFYRYVSAPATLTAARGAAGSALLDGQAGHLVTITSAAENAFIQTIISSKSWLDASDAGVEGSWRWLSGGAEAGQLFWLGTASGSAQGGLYSNWNSGEPNDTGGNEDGAEIRTDGLWNDENASILNSYVIEWEGAAILAARANGPYTVVENTPIGTTVGFVHSNDPDLGDTRIHSITGGSGAALFSVNPTTGEIIQTGLINYEAASSYTLDFRVQDAGGLFDTVTVTINIVDINDVPDQLNLSHDRITENEPTGTFIGTLTTIDQDPTDTHIYTLVTNPDSKFILVGDELRSNGAIDYERNQSFSVVIRTDDGRGGLLDRTFLIKVDDVMDTYVPPPSTPSPTPSDPASATLLDPVRSASLLRASLSSGEFGQMDAFYGMGDFHQILRENMTYEVRALMDRDALHDTAPSEDMGFDLPEIGVQSQNEDPVQQDRFTNLRQALKFFEDLKHNDTAEQAEAITATALEREQNIEARNLPQSSIDRQFVDVLTYHEQRQARLREALKSTT